MSVPTVVIIVLSLNQRGKTVRCLQSLSQIREPDAQILLWDNGSRDDTAVVVAAQFPSIHLHHCPENLGVAGGRNQAAKLAGDLFDPDFLLFIDNDMTVEPDFLSKLLEPLQREPALAATTGKILDMTDPQRIYGAGGCQIRFWRGDTNHVGYGEIDKGQYQRSHFCLPSGGCMLIRYTLFNGAGGFDELFNPYGPEDLDMGLRLQAAGYSGWYVPEAIVYHEPHPGRTFSGGAYSEQYAANRARQWLRFMRRHASWQQKLGFYAVGAPYLLVNMIAREYRRGNLLPALKGFWRGTFGQ